MHDERTDGATSPAEHAGGTPTPDAAHLLAAAFEAGGFGVALLDGRGRVVYANRPALALAGRTARDVIGFSFERLVHPDDRGWAMAELALVLSGEAEATRREVRFVRPDGTAAAGELGVRRVPPARRDAAAQVCALVMLEDAGDRPAREQELRRLADTDPLTELLNRRRFSSELERHLSLCARYGARGALLAIDLDGLKAINDSHGHLAGDRAIRTAADLLRSHGRASDLAARMGGDEFALLLPAATADQATVVARALLAAIRERPVDGVGKPVTFSVGIAAIGEGASAFSLFERADAALYEVKRAGGNGFALARDADPDAAISVGVSRRADPEPPASDRQELV